MMAPSSVGNFLAILARFRHGMRAKPLARMLFAPLARIA